MKKFLYWLYVPKGLRAGATDRQRRKTLTKYWWTAFGSACWFAYSQYLRDENRRLKRALRAVSQSQVDALDVALQASDRPGV